MRATPRRPRRDPLPAWLVVLAVLVALLLVAAGLAASVVPIPASF